MSRKRTKAEIHPVLPVHPVTFLFLAWLVLTAPLPAQTPVLTPTRLARIDSLFAPWADPAGAGCALGVSHRDALVLERAWGGAQLEHGVPNTPATIFEGGSVSKQFTAAAVILLALDGKLSLDDDVRRHVPEVLVYDAPITIRHLIHHTSGLKDWGSIASIGGWPRGSRIYTHAHVLEIIGRQGTLNHSPGAEYIYSNSNYNLLAIIAERVSGESLPALTKRLIFGPLGMTSTGWRDDFTRIVPGRAQAYIPGPSGSGWRLQMPNENVYGNSSLLTTVGDLLTWAANSTHGQVGGAAFRAEQQRRGVLSSGDTISYAGGIQMTSHRGAPEISHTGSTAGYRAVLARYPDSGWTVALLCNASNVNPGQLGRDVADVLHGAPPRVPAPQVQSPVPAAPATRPAAPVLDDYRGDYDSREADLTLAATVENGRLVLLGRPDRRIVLTVAGVDRFTGGGGDLVFTRGADGTVDGMHWTVARARNVRFVRAARD